MKKTEYTVPVKNALINRANNTEKKIKNTLKNALQNGDQKTQKNTKDTTKKRGTKLCIIIQMENCIVNGVKKSFMIC